MDQGALGHAAVKPTQVATTSSNLWETLHGRLVPLGDLWHVSRGSTMQQRVQASKSHAAWAPQLVAALRTALRQWDSEASGVLLEGERLKRFEAAFVSKLDRLGEWKRHCEQGHLPWRRDCLACLQSAAYMRPHRRQRHPVLFNMMADLAGPYAEGEDVEVTKGKYILMVVYPFPRWVSKSSPEDVPIPSEFVEETGEMHEGPDLDGAVDPFVSAEPLEPRLEATAKELEAGKRDADKWATIVSTLKGPYEVINLCFVEILPDKRPSTVASGLSRIYARLRSFGFPVYGLFTDRGGEMVNSAVRTWCEARTILRQTTAPESPASNGRTERLLGLVRREARALLHGAGLGMKMWPHAVRHACEQRLRRSMAALSSPTKPMVPFWAQVTIRARTWNDKKWSTRALRGEVAAPSIDVDGGWIVRVQSPKGVQFYVSTLLYLNVQPPIGPPDLSKPSADSGGTDEFPAPIRRHRTKSSPLDETTVSDLDVAVLKEPGHELPGTAPKHRQRSKEVPAVAVGVGGSVGSVPVPGSFVADLAARAGDSESITAGLRALQVLRPLDKSIIEEDVPRLSRLVGSNPIFHEMRPTAGHYQAVEHVRYCRLTPAQWRAIHAMRPGHVPGLGDLWVTITPEFLRQPYAENPADLIPAALYLARHRNWDSDPVLTAHLSPQFSIDVALVRGVDLAPTHSGGLYCVFLFDDLVHGTEAVVLLWVELVVQRVYEPLPVSPPRLSSLHVPRVSQPVCLQHAGGDLSGLSGLRRFQGRQERAGRDDSPRISALRVNSVGGSDAEQVEEEGDAYVLLPQGVLGDSFELGPSMACCEDEERISRIPSGVQAPQECSVPEALEERDEEPSVASLDVFLQEPGTENRWYDALPGESLYLDDGPEDVLEAEMMLEDLDAQRQVKLRVVREQESCLTYELEQGEGFATREWLSKAYVGLGELEAQMSRLQYEQLQRTGLAPLQMVPVLASLSPEPISTGIAAETVASPVSVPEVLHTHSVPLAEVLRDLSSWHSALLEEFNSILTTHRAIRPISKEELRVFEHEGRRVLYVPGKLVATVKAGTGKRKARIVACGNFLGREKSQGSPTLSRGDIFAAGLDSLALRAQVAAAAWREWKGGTVDIRTAFLTAPLQAKRSQRVVVLRPPKILVTAGIVPEGSLYLIEKALYGLAESPQDWGAERDSRLRSLVWEGPGKRNFGLQQAKSDYSIWRIRERSGDSFEGPVRGLLGVYVDDLLVTAEDPLLQGLLKAITELWRCSTPQLLDQEVVFCGLQIQKVGKVYLLGQSKYIRELQLRHPDIRLSKSLPSFRDEEPVEGTPCLAEVREAQKYMGELQWLACRSRPDISFSVSRASRLIAKNPLYAIKVARQIMAYLFATVDMRLRYGDFETHPELATELPYQRSIGLVEAFSDASFGCEDGKSQSGVAVLLGSCLVAWLSVPQPFTTLSTCEAELVGACEALTLSQAIIPLWQELVETPVKWVAITDSVSAAAVLLYPSGSWRTRHLRLRCRAYQELIEEEVLTLAHVKGQFQVADLLTKALGPPRVRQLLDYLGCIQGQEEGERAEAKTTVTATGMGSQQGSVMKSMVALSCLLSPVRAQPVGADGRHSFERLLLWGLVTVFCCLIWYCLRWVDNNQRLLRLREMSKKGESPEQGEGEFSSVRPSQGVSGTIEKLPPLGNQFGPQVPVGKVLPSSSPAGLQCELGCTSAKAPPLPLRVAPKPKSPPPKAPPLGLSMSVDREVFIPSASSTVGKPPPLGSQFGLQVPVGKAPPPPLPVNPNQTRVEASQSPNLMIRNTDRDQSSGTGYASSSQRMQSRNEEHPREESEPRPPVKRPPLLPYGRFHGTPVGTSKSGSSLTSNAGSKSAALGGEDLVVLTPPRAHSSELPRLLSYEELIQRAMRRELNREPTREEVEDEIRRMAIRNARIARSGDSSGSEGSEAVTSSYGSSDSENEVGDQEASTASHFAYLPPEPVRIVRLVSPKGKASDTQGTVWNAVLFEGERQVPTTIIANEQPSSSSDPPNLVAWYASNDLGEGTETGAESSMEWGAANQREFDALVSSEALGVSNLNPASIGSDVSEHNVGEVDVDYQVAQATFTLHQHTSFQVPQDLDHLSEAQVEIYNRLLEQWRESRSEVD